MSNKKFFICKNCLNISTRPRIEFDKNGWCNACVWMREKKTVNWKKREKELLNLFKTYKSESDFDCIVPVSGGKDGSYIAYTLKKKYKKNPLCVNVTPPLPMKLGEKNLKNFIKSGFNVIQLNLDPVVMRHLNRIGFIEKGQAYFGWLLAVKTAVIKTALKFNIPLIFYAEDGEVEYGGSTETKNSSLFPFDYQKKVYLEGGYDQVLNKLEKQLKKSASFWRFPTDKEIKDKEIYVTCWSYFENWNSYRNYTIAKKFCGLKEKETRDSSTFINFAQTDQALYPLHMYLCYLKFGFGRALQDVGIEIRRGAMTRDQGKNLVKLYDGHYPDEFIEQYLDYYQMSLKEFNKVIDKWANKDLFKYEKGRWKPKFEII